MPQKKEIIRYSFSKHTAYNIKSGRPRKLGGNQKYFIFREKGDTLMHTMIFL